MKKLKPIIITFAICIVFAGAILAAWKLWPEKNVAEQPNVKPGSGETVYIVNKAANLVKSVDVTTEKGEKFSIEYSKNDKGEQVASLKGANAKFKYKTDDMYTLAGYVGILVAIEEIPDAKGRYKDFGFDKPKRKIKISFSDDQKAELLLGADAPSGDGVYIMRKDTERVYLIGGSTTSMLMKTPYDYRDFSLYEAYGNIEAIKEVSITRPGEQTITVRRKEKPEPITESNPVAPQYDLISPDKTEASNQPVEEKLLTPLIAIKSEKLVEDNPKDLGKYGLDNPVVVGFKDKTDTTHKLKIGSLNKDNKRYVMCDDVPSVLETAEDISFLNIQHTDLMMQLLWLHNMKDVAQINYYLPNGVQHVLSINTTDKGTTATFDGGNIASENATNLFMHSIQFSIQGVLDGSMKYGTPEYTMSMKLKSGATTTFQLARINERQYAAIVDGKAKYYVNISQVNALAQAFDILAKGGKIPSIF